MSFDADLAERVAAGVWEELSALDPEEMVRRRDAVLQSLLRLKTETKALP